MNNASIDETSSVYTCSEKASINWRSVGFSELQVFTTVVQGLLNDVGKLDEDEPWFDFLRRIRSFRFSVVASLLSEKLLQEKMTELVNNLHASRNRFIQSYPNSEEKYHRLIQIGEHLCKLKFSGLLSPLLEEIASSKRFTQTVVLVCESRFVGESEECLASAGIRTVEIASPPFLRGDVSFEKMIVIGPTRYKTEHAASYAIDTLELLAGDMPQKYEKPILQWASRNQKSLLLTWNDLKAGKDVRSLVLLANEL